MRERIINTLAQMLQSNIGNRLTNELATGIATTLNQMLLEAEAQAAPKEHQD